MNCDHKTEDSLNNQKKEDSFAEVQSAGQRLNEQRSVGLRMGHAEAVWPSHWWDNRMGNALRQHWGSTLRRVVVSIVLLYGTDCATRYWLASECQNWCGGIAMVSG